MLYHRRGGTRDTSRRHVPTSALAPFVLANFDVPIPQYMETPPHL